MRLEHQAPSENFEDRTGWSQRRKNAHTIATLLSPALAAANIHEWMQAHGLAPIKGARLRPGIVDLLKGD